MTKMLFMIHKYQDDQEIPSSVWGVFGVYHSEVAYSSQSNGNWQQWQQQMVEMIFRGRSREKLPVKTFLSGKM